MSKRIIIICEGQTEQAFCNDVLQPHFNTKDIYIQNPTIKKTGGGIVRWEALKHQIENHLKQDIEASVTTLIDYYGIYANHRYPAWVNAEHTQDRNARMEMMEAGMRNDIAVGLRQRFIPYMQLHEFEGLLFSDIAVFNDSFTPDEFYDYTYLLSTIAEEPNPEMINNGVETAPSKRLARIIKGYQSENENLKVLYGSLLAQDIGLTKIRSKCPRFNKWVADLEKI
jgi:hypothetical protein